MERVYVGVNFPNLVSIAVMVGVIAALYLGLRTFTTNRPASEAAE